MIFSVDNVQLWSVFSYQRRGWSEFQTATTPWTFLFLILPPLDRYELDILHETGVPDAPNFCKNHTRIRQRRGYTSLNFEISSWCLDLIFLKRGEHKETDSGSLRICACSLAKRKRRRKQGHACFSSCVSVKMATYHFWSFRKLMALLWSDMLSWLLRLLRSVMSRHRYTLFRLDATGLRAWLERSLPDQMGHSVEAAFIIYYMTTGYFIRS